jgi:hypothetical protein
MVVFQASEGIMFNGLSSAGNALPGTISLAGVDQQGDHSSVGIFGRIN